MNSASGHRSLADQLRSWSPERLSHLLLLRPDLATPAPHDSGHLAARAATRSSVVRALDELDTVELYVLDALSCAGQTTLEQLIALVNADAAAIERSLRRLLDMALAWESVGGLRAVTGVVEALRGGPGCSGVRPFSADPLPTAELERRLGELSEPAMAMLSHVDEHGGEATSGSARTTVTVEQAATPAEELIARRLLLPREGNRLVLPGEVAVAVRGGHTTRERIDEIPPLPTSAREQSRVDRIASGAAFELVRRVELLLDTWTDEPPSVLRSGGLGVRDLRATAQRLHVTESEAALLVEIAGAAGLLAAAADEKGNPRWIPTDAFDDWIAQPPAQRWTALARAWLEMPRMPALVGQRDTAGKTWNALVPELASGTMAEARRMTLEALAEVPAGEVLASGTGGAGVLARIAWTRPRRPRTRADQVGWTLTEAPFLGVTGFGGLTSWGRAMLTGEDAAAVLAELLPDPVDHVLLQADLTAVAPGPLESRLARQLQTMAEVESRGGATVYRFTPGSVRRAMDLGWSSAELQEFVGSVSRTPVPQPLSYLIDDTGRTFGTLRVGYAGAYLRSEDEHALAELLAHPEAETLGLHRLAPTVLVSSVPIERLLPRLRELGAAPVVEDGSGAVHLSRPEPRRARTPRRDPAGVGDAHAAARASAVASRIRSGDRDTGRPRTPVDSVSALREAADAGSAVTIGFVDGRGVAGDVRVVPLQVEGGQLTAQVGPDADDVRRFPLSRVRSVRAD